MAQAAGVALARKGLADFVHPDLGDGHIGPGHWRVNTGRPVLVADVVAALDAAGMLVTPQYVTQVREALARQTDEMAREHYAAQLIRGGTLAQQQVALAEANGMRLVAGRIEQREGSL